MEGALDARAPRRTCRSHTTSSHLLKQPHGSVEGIRLTQAGGVAARGSHSLLLPNPTQPVGAAGRFLLGSGSGIHGGSPAVGDVCRAACETNILSLAPGRKQQAESWVGRTFFLHFSSAT